MTKFSIPPCPDNWESCSWCGAGPNEECKSPDYEEEGRKVSKYSANCPGPCACKPWWESYVQASPTTSLSDLSSDLSPRSDTAGHEGPRPGAKLTNLKDIAARSKVSASLVPEIALIELAQAFRDGAQKYEPFNWRDSEVNLSVYVDAMYRHLALFNAGQDNAEDSGLSHLTHIMSGCAILLDGFMHGTVIDDRYKPKSTGITVDTGRALSEKLGEYKRRNEG